LRLRNMLGPPNPATATDNSASDAGSGTSGGSDWAWTARLLGKAKPEAFAEAASRAVTS
jgi:hypothetical protein